MSQGSPLNELVSIGTEVVKQPIVVNTVGTLLARLLLRGNADTNALTEIKKGHFTNVIKNLYEKGMMTNLEIAKCTNFIQIATIADEYTKETAQNNTNVEFDFDWFVRFYEAAGNINDKKMQDWWGKLLAGEIIQPGHFSLRSLTALMDMSKNDADLFLDITQFAILVGGKPHIYFDSNCFDKYKINVKVHNCASLGVISNSFSTKYAEHSSTRKLIFYTDTLCCIANKPAPYRYNIVDFGKVGIELFSLVDYRCNYEFVLDCFRSMRSEFPELDLTIHKLNNGGESILSYDLTPLEIE